MSESSPAPEEDKTDVPPPAITEPPLITKDKTHLPPPIEIAKIAAILSRGGCSTRNAIDEAIALYFQAEARYSELAGQSLGQILKEVGDLPLLDWISERAGQPKKLRLYPDNAQVNAEIRRQFFEGPLDQVRSYLHKKAPYLNMRKTRSVLDTIKLYFLKTAYDHNQQNNEKIEELEKRWAQTAEQATKESRRTVTIDEVRNGWELTEHDPVRRDGEREYEDFMDQAAVRTQGTWQGHHFCPGKELYWELPETFLDKVIAFRRNVKKTRGGIRAVRDRVSKASTKKIRNLSGKTDAKRRNLAGKRSHR